MFLITQPNHSFYSINTIKSVVVVAPAVVVAAPVVVPPSVVVAAPVVL